MPDSATNAGDTRKPVNWWHTLPGVLTALAAVITAITGLVVALRSNAAPGPEANSPPAAVVEQPGGRTSSPATNASLPAETVSLPSAMEVRLAGGDAVFRILSARLEPFNREKRSLVFSVRYTNNGRYPANFWVASFRLLVEDVPRAPTNSLNEVVAGESAKEGEVAFEVPADTTRVALRISAGDERTDIPFVLPAAQS